MSEAMVDWKVCFSLGRLKGPGTKSRATGSEDGGDWMGCREPRLYFGGWYWYLHERFTSDMLLNSNSRG